MEIKSKHIVITGGTSGIGFELVKRLHQQNQVTIIARSSQRLFDLEREFSGVSVVGADLSDIGSLEKVARDIIKAKGHLDVLINNAAIQYTPTFLDEEFDPAMIRQEVDVNFTAPCVLIFFFLPALLRKGPALIVNINSGLGLVPKTRSAVYCGTKGGLNLFSQSLRHQLAHTNIRVVQAFLPLVDTKMTEGRGRDKISASEAALLIIEGLGTSLHDIDLGKVKMLRLLHRVFPGLAQNIMKRA